ncbi:MAG: polysulfide reductase NrfD [Acidobacteria bacterium]|nr:polysulfide reductase NrfD [Acidobacteriota bacterium]
MGSAKLDGQVQSDWRWLIAAYLFLAGVGGGAYLAGVVADLAGGAEWMLVSKIGVFLSVPCVLIGTFFLLADLGTPTHAWRVWMKPGTSWIARGTIIIVIFMILAAVHTAFWIWPFAGPLEVNESARHFLGILGALFAFLTVIYTGLLLGYSQPIALWRTALLPVLFFVSAISTGLMGIMIIAQSMGIAVAQLDLMENIDAVILVFEVFVLAVYVYNAYRTLESRPSAQRILSGPVASYFWLGVVVCGLAIPLILELMGRHGAILTIGALLGLFGGLCLRFTILVGGIYTPMRAAGFEFARIHRPKDPIPAMGKLPPS